MPSIKQIFFVVIAVLLIAIAVTYYRIELERIASIREAITKGEAVLQQKKDSVRDYQEKVTFYKTQEGLEHLAREQYNLITQGERVFLLKSPDNQPDL
ncbi:MAG: hypothetical protein IJT21_11245 [Synergistaceae bacterium]|nr:hypothetical protein [Synergistaceae bacterium]